MKKSEKDMFIYIVIDTNMPAKRCVEFAFWSRAAAIDYINECYDMIVHPEANRYLILTEKILK